MSCFNHALHTPLFEQDLETWPLRQMLSFIMKVIEELDESIKLAAPFFHQFRLTIMQILLDLLCRLFDGFILACTNENFLELLRVADEDTTLFV